MFIKSNKLSDSDCLKLSYQSFLIAKGDTAKSFDSLYSFIKILQTFIDMSVFHFTISSIID